MNDVTIIGSGVGGLTAACCLANDGYDVTVVEQREQLGGVASRVTQGDYQFDFGPSWYLMPEVFERFFARFDKKPSDYYTLERLDPRFSIFYKDGDAISVPDDTTAIANIFEEYEEGSRASFNTFMNESERTYRLGMDRFVWPNRQSLRDFLDIDVLRSVSALNLFRTSMDAHVASYFDNTKLQQLMLYSLVFLGGTPKTTPAMYKLMNHVVLNQGVYYPVGGMRRVPEAIAELGRELGVTFYTDREVTSITGSVGNFSVGTENGTIESDVVISNASYQHTEQQLLPPSKRQYDSSYWDERTYSPSAFLLYAGVEEDLSALSHHTLVLPEDWSSHFASITEHGTLPENPAYYINVPSLTDEGMAPKEGDALTVLVPIAPDVRLSEEEQEEYKRQIIEDIDENTPVTISGSVATDTVAVPSTFMSQFNRPSGTALGLAHTLRQTSILRPSMQSNSVEGLYFTGGDTTPGIGVPMCVISGMHAAETVNDTYSSSL